MPDAHASEPGSIPAARRSVLVVMPSVEGTGGAERSLLATAPYYAEAGIDLCVVVFADFTSDVDSLRASGAEVIDLSGSGGRLAVARALRRLLRTRRPDLVHTVLYDADISGRLAAWGLGIPVMSSIVTVPAPLDRQASWRARAARLLDQVTARWACDHFHAVTPGVRSASIARFRLRPERVSVVERGRDPEALGTASPERRARTRAALGIDPGAQVVVAAGRHYPAKDHVTLVRAVARVQHERPELVLVLAGRIGPTTDAIEAAREAAPDPSRILVLGHRDDVADVVAASDVFVSPSTSEGAAGAVIEALAIGVPIVCTDVEGLEGQVRDQVEVLQVPIGDPSTMADAIGRVLDDADLAGALVEQGRRRFQELFDLEVNARRLVALSVEVAARRTSGRWGSPSGDSLAVHAVEAEQTAAFYDGLADGYSDQVGSIMAVEQELFGRFVPAGASVLDLGVGAGRTTAALRSVAGRYVGIDLSPNMIDQAQMAHPDADLRVGDATRLADVDDGSFDVVVFSYNGIDSLRPVEIREACLREVHRVLRPGGTFIFSSHNIRALAKPFGPTRRAAVGTARWLGIWAVGTARLSVRRLTGRAFWQGRGYESDVVHRIPMYGASARAVDAQLRTAGFEPLARLSGEFPDAPPAVCSEHWHYAYRSMPTR